MIYPNPLYPITCMLFNGENAKLISYAIIAETGDVMIYFDLLEEFELCQPLIISPQYYYNQ